MKPIIIYGGSFDPIHLSHLKMAKLAKEQINADFIFLPSKKARWKEVEVSASDRLNMLVLGIKECLDSSFELESGGKEGYYVSFFDLNCPREENYTIDAVNHFKEKFPDRKLYLLIGGDQVNKFPRWIEASTISKKTQILYFSRCGEMVDENVVEEFNMRSLDGEIPGFASTDIRLLKSIDTPTSVLRYIEEHRLYFIKKMENYISGRRLSHSIEVAKLSHKIALSNPSLGLEYKAYVAGLLHDIAKAYPTDKEKERKYMEEHYPGYLDLPEFAYHEFIGADIVKKDFGIDDEEILDAIRCHATGKKDMSPLAMILYSADKIEPTRGFDSTDLINSCLNLYYQGFLDTLAANKEYLIEHDKDIHNILTDECFKMYLGE